MFRKALSDYLDRIKIKVSKENFVFGKVWWFIYMLVLLPCMMMGNGKGIALGSYYIMVVPMLFGIYSMSVAPIELPKQMYLCPMAQSERNSYVRMLYRIRVIVPILVGIVIHGLGVGFGICSRIESGCQIYGLIAMIICMSITTFQGGIYDGDQKDVYHLYTKRMRGLQAVSLIGMVVALFYKVMLVYNTKWHWEGTLFQVFNIAAVVLMTIMAVLSLTYVKPLMEQLTIYDKSYSVYVMTKKSLKN